MKVIFVLLELCTEQHSKIYQIDKWDLLPCQIHFRKCQIKFSLLISPPCHLNPALHLCMLHHSQVILVIPRQIYPTLQHRSGHRDPHVCLLHRKCRMKSSFLIDHPTLHPCMICHNQFVVIPHQIYQTLQHPSGHYRDPRVCLFCHNYH